MDRYKVNGVQLWSENFKSLCAFLRNLILIGWTDRIHIPCGMVVGDVRKSKIALKVTV